MTVYSPQVYDSSQVGIRLPGEEIELSPAQQNLRDLTILSGDSFTLWWSNPSIRYAKGFRLNFRILIASKNLPAEILPANVVSIWPECRGFPNAPVMEERRYEGRKDLKHFFPFFVDEETQKIHSLDDHIPVFRETNVLPVDSSSPEDTEPYSNEEMIYSYTFSKEQLQQYARNYDKIFVAVQPVIEKIYNDDESWRDTAELNQFPERWDWTPFICIFDTETQYCSDEYWDEKTKSRTLGTSEWRKCQMYYCSEGRDGSLVWKLVTTRWSPDGERWVFC